MNFYICESDSFDPCRNLAIEEYLLKQAEDAVILYLWQNAHTVVIGKNQNAVKECRTALLEKEGGKLVRRLSGGGAVYHDLGNLNFTFLMPRSCFDETKQFSVILEALASFGIHARFTGRNDLTADGLKFSGNAYYKSPKAAYHHGTLLVNADMEKMTRYLSPSKAKLQSKGVDSVRSRVVNLKQLCPGISVDGLKQELKRTFAHIYAPAEAIGLPEAEISLLAEKYRSREWTFGRNMPFTLSAEDRFSWGSIRLELRIEKGMITEAAVWSDCMDADFPFRLADALTGCALTRAALTEKIRTAAPEFYRELTALADQIL